MATALPGHCRTLEDPAVGMADLAGEAILHVVPEARIGGELRPLRAPGAKIGMPLRRAGAVFEAATTGCRVAADLP